MVKLLLNKGANLSAIDKKERQPIHCAAYLGMQVFYFFILSSQSCTAHFHCPTAVNAAIVHSHFHSNEA